MVRQWVSDDGKGTCKSSTPHNMCRETLRKRLHSLLSAGIEELTYRQNLSDKMRVFTLRHNVRHLG